MVAAGSRDCLVCVRGVEAVRTSLPVGFLLSLLAWSAHWVSQVARPVPWDQGLGPGQDTGTPGRPRRAQNLWAWLLQSQEGRRAPASSQGSCCHAAFIPGFLHLLLPLGLSAPPVTSGLLAVEHLNSAPTTRQRCFHISSPSSWDRPASLLGQL